MPLLVVRNYIYIYIYGIYIYGISNSLFNYCNVTITLYAYILVCFLVSLAHKKCKLSYLVPHLVKVAHRPPMSTTVYSHNDS